LKVYTFSSAKNKAPKTSPLKTSQLKEN